LTKSKQASILKVPPSISPRLSKSILAKSKYFRKVSTTNTNNKSTNCSYIQASKDSIKDIAKIKNTFLKLPTQKVLDIYKILNNTNKKEIKDQHNNQRSFEKIDYSIYKLKQYG